ncbi:glycosyltransferase family 2 protein [Roseobacter sp. S98]|uniref:glycosyltransferase family 2 protein n=1 Tax=Roseobacter algicola (ex Choi et al. 2025) (nom. illeg.) TaxID=3092138 RepID=UPI003F510092
MTVPAGGSAPQVCVDIGVFAYNEEAQIGALIADLARQTIFETTEVDLQVLVLANGCTDNTVGAAEQALAALPETVAARIRVLDLEQGGKSRTGHRYIHELSRPSAEMLGFMDGDIRLPAPRALLQMVQRMQADPGLRAFSSRPVKDVVHDDLPVGTMARVIAMGGDGLTDFRKSICGQLFMLRGQTARRIGLPAGLPVEDGFIRAMTLTELLSAPEDTDRIDGDPEIFHVYESIRSPLELIRHQIRIVVGTAVNAALFRRIRRDAPTEEAAHGMLMQAAEDPRWLRRILQEDLPVRPYGYVPFDLLTKRLKAGPRRGLRGRVVLALGLVLDLVAWLGASWRMWRGQGAGHW